MGEKCDVWKGSVICRRGVQCVEGKCDIWKRSAMCGREV